MSLVAAALRTLRKPRTMPPGSRLLGTSARDAADAIKERTSLSAVKELEQNPHCVPLDITSSALAGIAKSSDIHFGYSPINRILPLAFKWRSSSDPAKQLPTAGEMEPDRLPNPGFSTPMITLIDYVNEDVGGHPGLIHGGMTTVIAHSSMALVAALNAPKQASVRAKTMNMDYRRPIRTGSFVKVHAWLYKHDQDALRAAVHFYDLENRILAEAVSELAVSD